MRLLPAAILAIATIAPALAEPAVEGSHGMVVTSQRLASEAGLEILKAGGNAVDAAVAVGYALAVVEPCCGNVGGGGFMVLRLADGRERFLNFREMAPAAATRDMYLDAAGNPIREASLTGFRAAGIPGSVMGLDTALREYGHLTRAQVMAPAIRLARDGFTLVEADLQDLRQEAPRLSQDPGAAAIFTRGDGRPWQAGDKLVQRDLATTLDAIAQNGTDAFYKGRIPDLVAKASSTHGGIIAAKDFAAYHITETAPVTCSYRGYQIVSAPPPSSGGTTLCEILNLLEGWDIGGMGFHSVAEIHALAEAMRHAYVDRNNALGDPEVVTNPIDRLTSKDYAAKIRATIDPDKPTPSAELRAGSPPHEGTQTTHYSVVDGAGNAVAVTYTVNDWFGAAVVAPGTGFVLNDEMDDFTVKPGSPNLFGLIQGERNGIAPGKRPLSSMTPTLVLKDGKLVLVLGSPGGPRIITATLQTIVNVIDHHMSLGEAVAAPRIHMQWLPDQIAVERGGLDPAVSADLEARGYKLVEQHPWSSVEAIAVAGTTLQGVNDPRRPGGAAVGF